MKGVHSFTPLQECTTVLGRNNRNKDGNSDHIFHSEY